MRRRKQIPYAIKVLIAAILYAGVFAVAVMFGLSKFWDYIAAYEQSRSQNTIDAYMAQLTVSHMQDSAADLIASIDHNIQSEDACRQKIADSLSGGVTCARKLSECSDNQQVYMLLSGGKTIGKVTLTAQEADEFGFAPWEVTAETFDFSFLIGTGTKLTVPHNYPVYVNGTCLSSDYITESGMHFQLIEDFYETYSLPTMVTYEVAPILGELDVSVTDPQGNSVTQQEALDEVLVLNNCTESEIAELNSLVEGFIDTYVRYTSNADEDLQGNLDRLLTNILPDSALAQRMKDAKHGLRWMGDQHAKILSVTTHHRIHFLDGHYLYDVTYEFETNYRGKVNTTIENLKLIITPTESGLKVERMIGY